MSTTMMMSRKTPGVYINEIAAFPPSVVGVETAVPAFVGYTQRAVDPHSRKAVYNKPVLIRSMNDFVATFGVGFKPRYSIVPVETGDYDFSDPGLQGDDGAAVAGNGPVNYVLNQTEESTFYLYNAVRLFYANGGGKCYIVSVANYQGSADNPQPGDAPGAGVRIDLAALQNGLEVIATQFGPTMLIVPEAVLLPKADFKTLCTDMLAQCADLQDRVAILDVYGANEPANWTKDAADVLIPNFQAALSASQFQSYGMAYYPFLHASVTQAAEVNYTNLDITTQKTLITKILTNAAKRLYGAGTPAIKPVQERIYAMFPDNPAPVAPAAPAAPAAPEPAPAAARGTAAAAALAIATRPASTLEAIPPLAVVQVGNVQAVSRLNQDLTNALPVMNQIQVLIAQKMDVAPPSGAMAGLFTLNDHTRGVWNAPANLGLNAVVGPTVDLSDLQQGELNLPLNGMAVNVIRNFPGRGPIVWGARTLDGNSNDYRYIQVRRTLLYIEQSVKAAMQQFVFAPNKGTTWVAVTAMISNFLQGLWAQGGLMGDKASDAFSVHCGQPATMTGLDVLNGYMVVAIKVQMIHPAEFIELTFTQTMQGVA